MQVKCPKCEEALLELLSYSTGVISHCVKIRYEFSDLGLEVWEHSKAGYDPGVIFFDMKMNPKEKELKLKVLQRRIRSAVRDTAFLGESSARCDKYLKTVQQQIMSAVSATGSTKSMKGLTINLNDKSALTQVWLRMVLMHVRQHKPSELLKYQASFQNIANAIKYAKENNIPVLPHLEA